MKFARPIICVISGAQTGVDRAALDAALDLGVLCGGFVGLGREAEDGPLSIDYPVVEIDGGYPQRTVRNIEAADATLVILAGNTSPGTKLTTKTCRELQHPYKVIHIDVPATGKVYGHVKTIANWIDSMEMSIVLNVAGPRESKRPGIQKAAHQVLRALFRGYARGGL